MNGKKLWILIVLLALLGCGGITVKFVKGYGEELIEPMTTLMAENLVNGYWPAHDGEPAQVYHPSPTSIFFSVRVDFLTVQTGEEDYWAVEGVDMHRERYWKLVQQYATPGTVKAIYDMVASKIISKMIDIARKPVNDPKNKWHNRPGYSDEQVDEMFRLYAKAARNKIYTLERATQAPEEVIEAFRECKRTDAIKESKEYGTPEYEKANKESRQAWSKLYDLIGDDVDHDAFVWALRQRDRSPELLQSCIELVEDAILRAEEAAFRL